MSPILKLITQTSRSVVLCEGRREISDLDAQSISDFSEWLAKTFPNLTLRSGNATGSDDAFVRGFTRIDPTRIELVVPYTGHRNSALIPGARIIALDTISRVRESELAISTALATPKNADLIRKRVTYRRLKAKADYLIRDTLKVLGDGESLPRPNAALFWINPADPEAGGTGHTIRVCKEEGIPYFTQTEWLTWMT
jgi:hypothetical protein